MKAELHLVVLWEFARPQEDRILADMERHVEIVHTRIMEWPGDPEDCFARFYGAKLPAARGKVVGCGGGAFRIVIVRDRKPRYGWRETSRGLEFVNLRMFSMKTRYRKWTCGASRVHTTNSVDEARRDVPLLTGLALDRWEKGRVPGDLTVLPGMRGWCSLRELFVFLGNVMPYAVLRNAETLPDEFDPSLHGDIDILVPDAAECARVLWARRVFPEPYRVHYEIDVGGRPVRFDFRQVGDGYYSERWERDMLVRRREADGVYLLAPDDAVFALVYHAVYQKPFIAADYEGKAAALAARAGLGGERFEDWVPMLEDFLAVHAYDKPVPADRTVFFNRKLAEWRRIVREMESFAPLSDLRPANLTGRQPDNILQTQYFTGKFDGKPCFVKYSPVTPFLIKAEWAMTRWFARFSPDRAVKALFWHETFDGGAFVVQEFMEGRSLESLLAANDPVLNAKSGQITGDMVEIAKTLGRAKMLHRDVRPANLMIDKDGRVRIFDFQFAVRSGMEMEDPFVYDNPKILYFVGSDFRLGHGKWNDGYSMRRCLELMPDTEFRRSALEALRDNGGANADFTAALPKRTRRWMKKDLKRLRRRKWMHKLFRVARYKLSAEEKSHMAFVKYALKRWRKA